MGKYEQNLKTSNNETKRSNGWNLSRSSGQNQPSKRDHLLSSKESSTKHRKIVSWGSSEDRIQVLEFQNPTMKRSNSDFSGRIGKNPSIMRSSRLLQECESNFLSSNVSTLITKGFEPMTSAPSCNASDVSNLDIPKLNVTPNVLHALTAPQLNTNGRPAQTRKTPARPGASTATPITPNMEQSTPRAIPQLQPKTVQGSRLSSNESMRESTMESKDSLSVLQCNVARSYHSHVELLTYFHSHEHQVLLVSEPYTGRNDEAYNMFGFQLYQFPSKRHVKACVYVKSGVGVTLGLLQYSSSNLSVVEFKLKQRRLLLASAYIEPDDDKYSTINSIIQLANESIGAYILIGMDANAKHPEWGL